MAIEYRKKKLEKRTWMLGDNEIELLVPYFYLFQLIIHEIRRQLFMLQFHMFYFHILSFLSFHSLQFSFNVLESYAVPIQCGGGISILNGMGNEHTPTDNRPTKRVREEEPVYRKQKLGMSLDCNVHRDDAGHIGNFLNPNPVSTGLRLSCEKEERSSSITSTCENMTNTLPGVLSLGNAVKLEIDRQMEEFGQYITLQVWQ